MSNTTCAARTADTLADAVTDPDAVRFTDAPANPVRAHPHSLAGGATGLVLLHVERARTGHGDPAVTRAWLRAATRDPITSGSGANLFYGAPALAFATLIAAENDPALRRAHTVLHTATNTLTRYRLDAARARIQRREPAYLAEFDLIRGLTGLGAYHLRADPHGALLRGILTYLTCLTEPIPGRGHLPGWWCELAPNGVRSPDFPGGHGNLGMSHGIAAPLALLALTQLRGITVPGQMDAIARIRAFYDTWCQHDATGAWWPGYVTREHLHAGTVSPGAKQRPSWCYGTPGIARAHQLAALATGDAARQHDAEHTMLACLREETRLRRLTGIGLCHGLSGALLAAWRMSHHALTPELRTHLPGLTTLLQNRLRTGTTDPELLDGHAGAALALHTTAHDQPAAAWDACLGLS